MIKKITHISGLVWIILLASCKTATVNNSQTVTSYTRYVNPFIGTAPLTDPKIIGYTPPKDWRVWAGLVYPGSTLPNAMVQLSPVTEYGSGAGYEYEDTLIMVLPILIKAIGIFAIFLFCLLPIQVIPVKNSFPVSLIKQKVPHPLFIKCFSRLITLM